MNTNAVVRIAALIGEPARAAMLLQLMDGRAMTATELARVAGISPATGSRHLALMVQADLLRVNPVGRHRYYRIGSQQVARLVEDLLRVAGVEASDRKVGRTGPKEEAMRQARTCYDHVAGRLGVAIADKLADDRAVVLEAEGGWVTGRLADSLGRLGLDEPGLCGPGRPRQRALCRPCMDWSERRLHVAGHLGASILEACLGRGWLSRRSSSRALDIRPNGQLAFRNWLGLERWNMVAG